MKVDTLYLSTGHIVPSTLIVLEENECSGTIATVEYGEQIAVVDSDTAMWHNRLRHMSEKGMKLIHSKNFLLGLKCINMDFYESCVCKTKESDFCEYWEGKQKGEIRACAYQFMGMVSGIFPWRLSLLCYIY